MTLLAVAYARPSYLTSTALLPSTSYEYVDSFAPAAYAPTILSHTIQHLPTAVSHQSQTIVHEKRPYLRPILEYTPAAEFVRANAPKYAVAAAAPIVAAAPALTYAPAADFYATAAGHSVYDAAYGGYAGKDWNGFVLK